MEPPKNNQKVERERRREYPDNTKLIALQHNYDGMAYLFDLTGKTALVTGGARGLGVSMAVGLAEAGADIILVQVCIDMGLTNYTEETVI